MSGAEEMVQCERVRKHFLVRRGLFKRTIGSIQAVDDVTFAIRKGETLGLVGESGSGKSTLGRTILRLYEPTSGSIHFEGQNIVALDPAALRGVRQRMQMVFQDPHTSLNPRRSALGLIAEPLLAHGVGDRRERRERVLQLLDLVHLGRAFVDRFPHEMSGGQRQRIGIARALALNPSFVVLDEPMSALDVSIQAQIANLLRDLQRQLGLTYLFIAHDLSMVRHISSRVAVMYLGKIVELASRTALFSNPLHPYTHALISAVPMPIPRLERARSRIVLDGDIPSPANPPAGCRFHTRCPLVQDRCRRETPDWRETAPDHWVACHFPVTIGRGPMRRLAGSSTTSVRSSVQAPRQNTRETASTYARGAQSGP